MEVTGKKTYVKKLIEESNKIPTCHVCNNDGNIATAVAFCTDCTHCLCEACAARQCGQDQTKVHTLLRISKYEETSEDKECPPVPPRRYGNRQYCEKHPLEMTRYYCEKHHQKVCDVCVNIDHRKCGEDVKYYPDVFSKNQKGLNLKAKYLNEKRVMKISYLQNRLEKSKDSYCKAKSDINDHRKAVLEEFERIEAELESKWNTNNEGVLKELNDLMNLEPKLQEVCHSISTTESLDRLNTIDSDLKKLTKKIGSIYCKDNDADMKYVRFSAPCRLGDLRYEIDVPVGELTLKKEIHLNVTEGQGRDLKGCALLKDNKVVFSDWRNNELILVNSIEKSIFQTYKCKDKPMEMTRVYENDIAVLFPLAYRIKCFNVIDEFVTSPDCDIELKDRCTGMQFDPSCKLLVLLSKACIYFVDLKGNFVKQIDLDADIVLPNHLALFPGKYIYYSDVDRHSVTCIDHDGKMIKEYKYLDGDLMGPYGLFVDSGNILYICGVKMLLCVTPEDKWQVLISPEDGYVPQVVIMNEKNGLIYVGQTRRHSCDMPVFNFSKTEKFTI